MNRREDSCCKCGAEEDQKPLIRDEREVPICAECLEYLYDPRKYLEPDGKSRQCRRCGRVRPLWEFGTMPELDTSEWEMARCARCRAVDSLRRWRLAARGKPALRRTSTERRAYHRAVAGRWELFEGRCWLCGAPAEFFDHVKPRSKGGNGQPCNLRPVCNECNVRKGGRWPFDTHLRWSLEALPGDRP